MAEVLRGRARQTIALIGHPVAHSVSPAFQQAALDACGIPARYEAWDTPPADLPAAVERLRGGDVLGANVTVPHKVAILRHLDRPDALVERVGAVNTVVQRDGLLHATNTDVAGVLGALAEAGVAVRGRPVLLLGAGGAARAVVTALRAGEAASVTVANRSTAAAEALAPLAGEMGFAVCSLDPADPALRAAVRTAAVVVQATPLGMRHGPDETASPLPGDWLRAGQVAFDLVYVPQETPFLAAAAAAGAHVVGGLGMLVHQGAASFRLWTGHEAPLTVMWDAARRALAAREASA